MKKIEILTLGSIVIMSVVLLIGTIYAQDYGVPTPPTPVKLDGPAYTGGNLPSAGSGGAITSPVVGVNDGADQGVSKPITPVYTGSNNGAANISNPSSNATYEGGATIKTKPTTVTKPATTKPAAPTVKKKAAPIKGKIIFTRQCIKNLKNGYFGAGRKLPNCSDGWGGNGQLKRTKLNNQDIGFCRRVSNTGCSQR